VFDRNLRTHTSKLFQVIAVRTGLVKVHPDLISFIGLLFGIGSAVFILLGNNWAALAFWLVNRIVDGLDGEIARFRSKASAVVNDAGGYLDIFFDFIIYAAIPISIGFAVDEKRLWIVIAFLLASFYLNTVTWTYLAALIEKAKSNDKYYTTSIIMPRGLIEGTETIVVYTLFFIFFDQAEFLMIIMGILVTITALVRFGRSYLALKSMNPTDH